MDKSCDPEFNRVIRTCNDLRAALEDRIEHCSGRYVRGRLVPAVVMGLAIFVSGNADATCSRHIYNKSSKNWVFQAFPARAQNGDALGSVWFDGPSCQSENGPCVVKPGEVVATKFTTTNSEAKGQIRITDSLGKWVQGDYHGFEECPSVTGGPPFNRAVLANKPSRGDFTVLKDTWW